MIDNKYLRQIEEYTKDELKSYRDILSVKYHEQITQACSDIIKYGIDYIAVGFFTPVQPAVFLSNMPNWAIPYNREGWWRLDTINSSKTFYMLCTDHILQSNIKKNKHQEKIYKLCEAFSIYEAFSILKPLGTVDINIIAHTRHPILDINRFYLIHKQDVINFSCLFISRIRPILIQACPFLEKHPVLWDKNLLSSILNSELVYSPLTEKETEVLFQVSQGMTTKEIAQELGISIKSVNKALERTRKKLDCSHTFQAVSKALFLNIFERPSLIDQLDKDIKFSRFLSERELETVFLTAYGYSAKEIARVMNIEYKTAEKYISTAKNKLGCRNKTHLVYKALSLGLLSEYMIRHINS